MNNTQSVKPTNSNDKLLKTDNPTSEKVFQRTCIKQTAVFTSNSHDYNLPFKHLIERDLLARELSDTTTVGGVGTGSTTTATTTAKATATTATTTTRATTATTAAETTTTTSLAFSLGTRSAVVEADSTSANVGTLEVIQGLASLIDRGELDITVTLGAAGLSVGGETDSLDLSLAFENFANSALVNTEDKVANEKGVALRAGLVAE